MNQCETCKYFWSFRERFAADGGQCRFNAPVVHEGPTPRWPHVLDTDGCGQHQPNAEQAHESFMKNNSF